MALTQEQVDYWFAQNPEATADEVAEAVKSVGGLEANAGLADMIANRYNIDTSQVNDYYNQYAQPAGGLSVITDGGALEDTSADTSSKTTLASPVSTPLVADFEGTTYNPTVLKDLAIQLSQFTDTSKLSGGVYETKEGNIGFDYKTGTEILGKAPSTYEQVLLDAARSLAKKGITNINQLSVGDVFVGTDENGNPITQKSVINTATGLPIGTFGETYTGKGGTFYDAGVDPVTGKPYFGTHGKSSSDIAPIQEAIQDLGPLGNIALAFATGGLSIPQQLAANFAYSVAGGADPSKAALNALAAFAGNQILGVSEIKDATKFLDKNFGATFADAFKGAISGATRAGLTGGDVLSSALTGGVSSGVSSVGNKLFDSYTSDTSLSNTERSILKSSTSAFINAKLAGASDEDAFKSAALAGSASAASKVGADFKRELASTKVADGTDVTLPSGVQLAAADTGTVSDAGTDPFRVLSSGVPIYAESKNASAVDVPFGYSLLSISESDNKPEGSYYDITANAWFKPDANIDKLLTSGNIKSDIDLFNSSQGDLDAIAADADSESADYTASFLKSIGINTTDELKDSKLSNADIEEMIGLTDFSGTTGSKAGDDIPELVVTDNKDKGDDVPELVITDKKDEIPELVITDTKDEIPEVVVTDTKDKEDDTEKTLDCPEGYEPNADNTACIPVIEIVDKKCGEGFVYDEDLKQCVPIDEKKVLDCPEGYEPNEEGTACIPVIEIVDKKCEEGYVYDEELKQCVPIEKKTECGVGYHWDEATKSCVKDTVVTPPRIPPITTTKTSAATPFTPAQGGSGKDYQFLPEKLLKTYMTSGSFKDPLAGVKKAQQEFVKEEIMQQGVDPRLAALLAARVTGEEPPPKATYNYGEEPSSIDDILGGSERRYAGGGYVKPLMAEGGMALPLLAAKGGLPTMHKGREDFRDGKHVAGEGDGQSDDIPAMLADGEFVFPADVVSALGNGSTKAGTDKLYEMMHSIRDRARSKGRKDLPPPALKSPLDYLKKR